MATTKDILLTTATAVSTVGFAVSMALHFTPWPHGDYCDTGDTLDLKCYKLEELTNVEAGAPVAYWNKKEKPKYVRVTTSCENGNNASRVFPIQVNDRGWNYNSLHSDYALNVVNASFVDGTGIKHNFTIQLTAYPSIEFKDK